MTLSCTPSSLRQSHVAGRRLRRFRPGRLKRILPARSPQSAWMGVKEGERGIERSATSGSRFGLVQVCAGALSASRTSQARTGFQNAVCSVGNGGWVGIWCLWASQSTSGRALRNDLGNPALGPSDCQDVAMPIRNRLSRDYVLIVLSTRDMPIQCCLFFPIGAVMIRRHSQ